MRTSIAGLKAQFVQKNLFHFVKKSKVSFVEDINHSRQQVKRIKLKS